MGFNFNDLKIVKELESEITAKVAQGETDTKPKSMLRGLTARETMILAKGQPDPVQLYMEFWYEGELCCLFSDSNLGKSIFAVQIGNAISQTRKTVYCDFELSDKQFQQRYTDEQGRLFEFNENLIRVTLDPDNMDFSRNFEEALIADIENYMIEIDAKVLIIDNLTYLCAASEKGDAAGNLMKNLCALKKKHGWSILVLAHTPKRNQANPITKNDLAGSRILYNFFDSCFAIGESAKDKSQRYIKQLKVRAGAFTYDSENVLVANIEKEGAFLQFNFIGFAPEREHLKELTSKDRADLINEVKRLKSEGLSIRAIAERVGMSKSTIGNIVKE